MDSYSLMFYVFRSFLVFSGFGLKSLASGFQFYSSNSLKSSPTMQHFRDFNPLHRSFLKPFPLFIWLLFAISLVSNFRPDIGRRR